MASAIHGHSALIELLKTEHLWPHKRWAVKALSAKGQDAKAIDFAEQSRGPWSSDHDIDRMCEGILLSRGQVDVAYRRYGLWANRAGTYTAEAKRSTPSSPTLSRQGTLRSL